MKILISTLVALAFLALLFSWLQRRVWRSAGDLNARVYPLQLKLGDTLFFADKSSFARSHRWAFGDGNILLSDSGYYRYSQPGYYQVSLTVNNSYSRIFNIRVLDTLVTVRTEDSVTIIEAPEMAMQFENVVFRARTRKARLFSWKFGESQTIDAREAMAIYAYQQPGEYLVSLSTDETPYPALHKIKILPSYKLVNDSTSLDDAYREIDDDFKYHLQQIANGSQFNEHYNYLLRKYLCGNENTVMRVNGSKLSNFYYYCSGLQFDKQTSIQAVKVGFDNAQDCVTKVEVQQTKE
jgi:hypothetical protein